MSTIKEELSGKRLLILGGSLWNQAIKQFCDEYGVTIIAAGNDPHAGMCDIADEYYNVNSTDSEVMKQLIAEKRIDGVYMGGNEPVIAVACQYIRELGLPCYCTKEQWDALQDKIQFKALCQKFGLPVAKQFEFDSVNEADFPVITKPADGSGSRGFSVCHDYAELEKGYAAAKSESRSGNVIVEQFVPNESIVAVYTVIDGRLYFSTIEDKYPVLFQNYGTYVGGLFDFESGLIEGFRCRFEDTLQKLITYLDIKEGNFWIEIFNSGDQYYFNEAGFRYGGSGTLFPVDYFRRINQVALDIYFALTGISTAERFVPLYGTDIPRGKRYAIYPVFVRTGKIGGIKGLEEMLKEKEILNILIMKKPGSYIPDNGSFGQVCALVHFIYENEAELKRIIQHIHATLIVEDGDGENMVVPLLDITHLKLRAEG